MTFIGRHRQKSEVSANLSAALRLNLHPVCCLLRRGCMIPSKAHGIKFLQRGEQKSRVLEVMERPYGYISSQVQTGWALPIIWSSPYCAVLACDRAHEDGGQVAFLR